MVNLSAPDYWDQAIRHLSADTVMKKLITSFPNCVLTSRGSPFYTLMRSIIGQQVSVSSADALWAKLEALQTAQRSETLSPDFILSLDDDTLRGCGLSRQKISYSRNLANFFLEGNISEGFWDQMSDEDVVSHITQVKGIGRWSAEMFLMFHLMRPDLFPLDDIGLQRALQNHYGLTKTKPFDKEAALTLAATWQPYRTVATWFLWRSLDPVVVNY